LSYVTPEGVSAYTLGSMMNEAAVANREAPVDMNVLLLRVFSGVMVPPLMTYFSHTEFHSYFLYA